jgi:hypothetical protein
MLKSNKAQLLIPVEHQVRELDPKLLLACVAAKRGFSSVVFFKKCLSFEKYDERQQQCVSDIAQAWP